MNEVAKGVVRIVVMSGVLLLIDAILGYFEFVGFLHKSMPWIILFYCLQSCGIHALLNFVKKTLDADFSIILIGGFVLRLMTVFMAVLIVVFAGIENHQTYIINFFTVYLLYLVFEIVMVLPNLRSN